MNNTYDRPRGRFTRRQFLGLVGAGAGAGAVALAGRGLLVPGPRAALPPTVSATPTGRVRAYTLTAAPLTFAVPGQTVATWGYNGGVPGPELRLTAGDTLRVTVENRLPAETTIHWHGLPIANAMDGVPGVTQPPIGAGQDFTYEFPVPVAGTYMYHSHVGLQLDRGLYGPLIVEPARETLSYDREFVLLLDDWLDGLPGTPEDTYRQLVAGGDQMGGMGNTGGMGGGMSAPPAQSPPDVTYPRYLINGKAAPAPEELRVRRGETVRLRLINPSASTIYRVALAGHRLTVTHTDGQPVAPVEVDAVRIGQGERYDVLVRADNPGVWQLAAQAEGTTGLARALFRYEGELATPPPPDFLPPELGRQLLLYGMLTAAPEAVVPPRAEPDQTVALALGGGMGQYVWTINGETFAKARPLAVRRDRHIRFQFQNTSMMPHPMHLHGHFFQVDNGTGRGPLKDTVLVEPMQQLAIDWVSDNPGDWAFHCHNAYHQEAGMMGVVKVG